MSVSDKIINNKLVSNNLHNPIYSNNPNWSNISYDKTDKNSSSETPDIMRGKEELAPSHIFNTY
jgi:hypothetical protein